MTPPALRALGRGLRAVLLAIANDPMLRLFSPAYLTYRREARREASRFDALRADGDATPRLTRRPALASPPARLARSE